MPRFDSERDADLFRLSRYLDGDLDSAEADQVQTQLAADAELAKAFDQLRRTDHLVRTWAGPAPELNWEGFRRQVAVRTARYNAQRRQFRMVRLFAPLAAAAVLAICATLYFRSTRPGPGGAGVGTRLAMVEPQKEPSWRINKTPVESLADVLVDRAPSPVPPSAVGVVVDRTRPPTEATALAASGRSSLVLAAASSMTDTDDLDIDEPTPYF